MLTYLIFIAPALILSLWAQGKVKSTYAKFSQIATRSGLTGAQVTDYILRDAGIALVNDPERYPAGSACGIEMTPGELTDHYDPRSRTLRLSPDIYHGQSIAALGIAAHEVGHAIQHSKLYGPLMLRNVVYPVCSIGSSLAWPLLIIGFILNSFQMIVLGVALFSLAVVFTVLTLPVEFDASRRAVLALAHGGYLTEDELDGAKKVLNAAALTYVAAAAMAIMQLLYYALPLLGHRE